MYTSTSCNMKAKKKNSTDHTIPILKYVFSMFNQYASMGRNAKKPFECTMQYTCDMLLIASPNASGLNCIVVDIALIELVFDLPCDRSID